MNSKKLGEILLEEDVLTKRQLQKALDIQQSGDKRKLGEILIELGYLTIENVVLIAQGIGISETVIGITIVAIGTSLPELITSITAIKKGHTDIGIGTIVGSNIYNILMIMGVASVITGIAVVPGMFTDYLVMIGFAVVLIAFLRSGIIPRPAGIGLAIAYAVYLGYTLLSKKNYRGFSYLNFLILIRSK